MGRIGNYDGSRRGSFSKTEIGLGRPSAMPPCNNSIAVRIVAVSGRERIPCYTGGERRGERMRAGKSGLPSALARVGVVWRVFRAAQALAW